jgi:hypothetical protein
MSRTSSGTTTAAAPRSAAVIAPVTPQPARTSAGTATAASGGQQQGGKKSSAKARADEFKAWAEQQMQHLTGSSDLTFVDFLFTLPSAGEVQEYCATYLGADDRTAAFASEFLRRKRADPSLSSAGGVFTAS